MLAFTETRLDDSLVPVHQLHGYKMHTVNRNRHGGGVALYVADNCYSSKVNTISLL